LWLINASFRFPLAAPVVVDPRINPDSISPPDLARSGLLREPVVLCGGMTLVLARGEGLLAQETAACLVLSFARQRSVG